MQSARTAGGALLERTDPHRLSSKRWLRGIALLLCLFSGLASVSQGGLEDEVEAAMIFNFTKFVEWPAASFSDDKAPFVVALVGQDELTPFVELAMRDKSVAGHPVRCVRLQAQRTSESYHLLVVAKSERKRGAEILRQWQRPGLLSISTMDGFVGLGGIIGIVVEGKRARFEINLDVARRSNLSISSKLLRLARSIQDHGGALE